jgi:hypothetical protein
MINGELDWKEFCIRFVDCCKGNGVFARINLPAGFCFPFGGLYKTLQEWHNITHHVNTTKVLNRTSHASEVVIVRTGKKKEKGVADAHPSHLVNIHAPFNAWPGAYCNQADQLTDQNAELFSHEGKCTAPRYDFIENKCRNLFVKLLRPVTAGEEIVLDYKYTKHKQTRLGIGYDAKKLKVKSTYSLRKQQKVEKYGETQII